MRIKTLLITLIIFVLTLAYSDIFYGLFAESTDTDQTVNKDDVEDLEKKIKKYEDKLDDLKTKEHSLSNEIAQLDGEISLTELRIQNSQARIKAKTQEIIKLAEDIDDLRTRISRLQTSIELQQKLLNLRLRERYKSGENSAVVILFGSETINQLIHKSEYLRLLEIQDRKMLEEMDRTKKAFINQKDLFEDKKVEQENLKRDLENEKANLDSYKGALEDKEEEKRRLLSVTQNDEAKYQKLLAEATRELTQITNAVSVLKNQAAKKVEKGDVIGVQGNSGYSFGDHLHFGVYKYKSFTEIDGWDWYYSNYRDPASVLKSKSVYWDTGCESARTKTIGSGSWTWPLSSPTISQGYGKTCWSNVYYGGKVHPAYDMYGPAGSLIYAAEDGDAYFCRNCLGDGGNGVFIFHENGYMTLYWHLR